MQKYLVPDECYKEYGNDLDGCSRQEMQGCKGCICLKADFNQTLKCPICGKPLIIAVKSGVTACSDSNCEYGHVVIEAVQWNGNNFNEINNFCQGSCDLLDHLWINTLEGDMQATVGDFIIKGVNGEFYPCKPDIFVKTYEKVMGD